MGEVRVEPARGDDAAAILAVHVAARSSYYRGFQPEEKLARSNARDPELYASIIRRPDRVVRVAKLGEEVVGFLMIGPCYYPEPDPAVTSELYQIHVHPDCFRHGIGTALHDEAISVWRGAGVALARLWAWDFNARALAFYAARGWVHDGTNPPGGPELGAHRMLGYVLDPRRVTAAPAGGSSPRTVRTPPGRR
ncbi:GNAT family N-acetyltransferase [Amycolatopsis alkalitolerans]|uniref:GNAT family N-acetyltransferase n=1 Tax=Amycolatopsis alkalitolerans TaxID=2547244 RepID=A0A5C4LZ33_9PSEU|nr:GNAT family N-acetyltransferase [Amycolatopsis alkalitolerans]TNC23349.1 GNAT family N-acetyltransferase [Amycolatopsis alkalitolerans]